MLQFLFLGAGLFLLYSLVNEDSGSSPDHIVIDAAQVTVLAEQFQRTWMRPTDAALLDEVEEQDDGIAVNFVDFVVAAHFLHLAKQPQGVGVAMPLQSRSEVLTTLDF